MNLFERLSKGRPAPVEEKTKHKDDPAQRLLTWLPRWPRDTITVRQIRVYGPHCLKGRMDAINAAEVLVANGFLTSTKAQRPDTYAWRIIRKNILNPTVGM
jgi:hypothetical protein